MTDVVARMKALPDLTNEKAWEVVNEGAKEIERLRETAKDARMLATAVIDAKVGCLPPDQMRTIAARIIAASTQGAEHRQCCYLHTPAGYIGGPVRCVKPAEWELWPSAARYEFVDACTGHVGALLDDAPETRVIPISPAKLLNPPMENSGETGNARAAPAMTGSLPIADAAPTITTADRRLSNYPKSHWDDCPKHEWKAVDSQSDNEWRHGVVCTKCGCHGDADNETGAVDWPAT